MQALQKNYIGGIKVITINNNVSSITSQRSIKSASSEIQRIQQPQQQQQQRLEGGNSRKKMEVEQ
jgi:hypothetical protein